MWLRPTLGSERCGNIPGKLFRQQAKVEIRTSIVSDLGLVPDKVIPDALFFAYNWKLPAYSGAFLLTLDNFAFYNWSFLLTVGIFCLQLDFLLTMGKCV